MGREYPPGAVTDTTEQLGGGCSETWFPGLEQRFPYWCTRERGHEGPHTAGTGEWVVAEWDDPT